MEIIHLEDIIDLVYYDHACFACHRHIVIESTMHGARRHVVASVLIHHLSATLDQMRPFS